MDWFEHYHLIFSDFDSDSFRPALVPEPGGEEAWCLPNLHPLEEDFLITALGRWPLWKPTFASEVFRTRGRANLCLLIGNHWAVLI